MSGNLEKFQIEEATIASIHEAMLTGKVTARQLVEKYISRIEAYDQQGPALNAVICLNPKALELADELDAQFKKTGFVGPLHGIPVLLKDNVNTTDMPTTAGSLSLKDVVPPDDAFITKKLREAGAIIIAKVNLHEFAVWGETASSIIGQTINPYDLTRTPGGSSGGTGAGVAANFGVVGIGSDTINSVRSPASACNLVGFRPTVGLISREGIVPYSLTQDMAGPLTRTVEDAVRVLDVICGYDKKDVATAWSVTQTPETYRAFLDPEGLKGKKIGVLGSFFGTEEEHQEVNSVIDEAIKVMQQKGAFIIDIKEEIDANSLVADVSVHLYELKPDLNEYLKNLGERTKVKSLTDVISSGKYHPGIEANIKKAETLSVKSMDYKDRLMKRTALQNQVMEIMADYSLDAMVYPHQKRLVVPIGETQVERNGVLASVCGFPSMAVPAGFSRPTATAPLGVPIGLEILGRPWSEPILIQIAYSYEQATKHRKPPVSTPPIL